MQAIDQALAILPAKMDTPKARFMMFACGYQESKMASRYQVPRGNHPPGTKGPARGLWQFEQGGGVFGVMRHEASKAHAIAVCQRFGVPWDARTVWQTLETNDVLAAAFARLLLWTDPRPLPGREDVAEGWSYYYRNWRPGAPRLDEWPHSWEYAKQQVPAW